MTQNNERELIEQLAKARRELQQARGFINVENPFVDTPELDKSVRMLEAYKSQNEQQESLVTLKVKGNKLYYSIDIDKFDALGDGEYKLYTSPPKQMPDGWISVKDKLPEKYTEVLVYPQPNEYSHCASYGKFKNKQIDDGWFYGEYEKGFGHENYACKVTHWMPLPPVPTNAEVVECNGWRSIKTAPRGEAVLVSGGDCDYPCVANYSGHPDECWCVDGQMDTYAEIGWPTHWMPLDSLPKLPPSPTNTEVGE